MDLSRFRFAPTLKRHLLANARVVRNREEILPLLPKGGVVCEVGVALGDFSREMIRECQPSRFIAIDLFNLHDHPDMWLGRVGSGLGGLTHLEYYRRQFAAEVDSGLVQLLAGNSTDMLATLTDGSVDVFYVDANHSYEAVRAELDLIRVKIASGGWIILNDY